MPKIIIDHRKLVDVTEKMCDGYCKWPFNTETQADLNEKCDECPLNNILIEGKDDDEI